MEEGNHDTNFAFPITQKLENDRVRLVPWNSAEHSTLFFQGVQAHQYLFDYLPWGPLPSIDSVTVGVRSILQNHPSSILFAVFAQPGVPNRDGLCPSQQDERFAGIVGLMEANKAIASAEIGYIMILPFWQRTCITTHTVGLMLHYLLDPLPPFGDGLGLRRVLWRCHSANVASCRAAERIGFVYEGTVRWARVVQEGDPGDSVSSEGRMHGKAKGCHSCRLSIVWDEWEAKGGTREHVQSLMAK